MYLTADIRIDLASTTVELKPPTNFFRGIANLLTGSSWSTSEEIETYKLMAFVQSTYRALSSIGVSDVLRVAIGDEVIYEDFEDRPNDFELAMEALERRLRNDFEPDPSSEFDLVLRYRDNVLTYVIDLDFLRRHRPGIHPVSIKITAVPVKLGRLPDEDDRAYKRRVETSFPSQQQMDQARERWHGQLSDFVAKIESHFQSTLGIHRVIKHVYDAIPAHRDESSVTQAMRFGMPFYGFIAADLLYLTLWDSIWQNNFRFGDVYYGDPWSDGEYIGASELGLDYASAGLLSGSRRSRGSGGGTSDTSGVDSGWSGGDSGFFASIGGFFDGLSGGDSGGSDGGGSDSGGGDSGGSSCGGGGGCGGGGD